MSLSSHAAQPADVRSSSPLHVSRWVQSQFSYILEWIPSKSKKSQHEQQLKVENEG